MEKKNEEERAAQREKHAARKKREPHAKEAVSHCTSADCKLFRYCSGTVRYLRALVDGRECCSVPFKRESTGRLRS